MPLYDYQCKTCEQIFEARHGMTESAPPCPHCASNEVQRVITSVPAVTKGFMAHAGDGKTATKDQLRSMWAEETPKLRKKLADKVGEETVNRMAPTLNTNYDD